LGGGAKGQFRQINKFVKQTKSSLKSAYSLPFLYIFWWLVILIFNEIYYLASIRFLSKSERYPQPVRKFRKKSEKVKKYNKTMLLVVRLRIK
jgi:hypothetical protein